jgi:hypothetical protein
MLLASRPRTWIAYPSAIVVTVPAISRITSLDRDDSRKYTTSIRQRSSQGSIDFGKKKLEERSLNMPTGYTADLVEGKKDISFESFAMSCARNFGALISMREDPMDAKVPEEFKPSPYYADRIKELRKELAHLNGMTPEERLEYGRKRQLQNQDHDKQSILKAQEIGTGLGQMLNAVKSWKPPTPDHFGLKNFMVEQLESTIKYDTEPYLIFRPDKSVESYHLEAVAECSSSLSRAIEENVKEVECCRQRTEWVKSLRESFKK